MGSENECALGEWARAGKGEWVREDVSGLEKDSGLGRGSRRGGEGWWRRGMGQRSGR